MEAGHARREVQPGDGQLGAGHRRADVRAGGPPHRREAGPHPQARPSPTRSPASRRPPCAARPAAGTPRCRDHRGVLDTGARVEKCAWLDAEDFAITARTGKVRLHGKGDEVRSVPLARRGRELVLAWLDVRGPLRSPWWPRKPADRARLLCAGRDLGAMSARRASTPASSPTPMAQAVGRRISVSGVARCGRRTTTTCSLPVPRFGSPLDDRGARMSRWLRSIRPAACRAAAPGRCPRRHTQSCQVVGRARRRALGPGGRARPLAADASRPRSGGRR